VRGVVELVGLLDRVKPIEGAAGGRSRDVLRMGERVVADGVPVRDDPAGQVRVCRHVRAGDEERGAHRPVAQHVQQGRRVRPRSVVEGQRDQAPVVVTRHPDQRVPASTHGRTSLGMRSTIDPGQES
jgi:hypothetical protein